MCQVYVDRGLEEFTCLIFWQNNTANISGDRNVTPVARENDTGDTKRLNERQKWILEEIGKGKEIRRSQVENKFSVSEKTAKRDFSELLRKGIIEFVRKPHPGYYRQKN